MNNTQANVSASEIAKFDALAEKWWDPNGPMKPLHQLNPLRLNYILNNSSLKNLNILDIGCGGGILSESLKKANANVTAIDMSNQAITIAKQHAKKNQLDIHYQVISAEAFAKQQQNAFDVITCMELLEHVPNPKHLIQAAGTLLKPNGLIFFSTINRNIKAYCVAILGAEYLLNVLPRGTHQYKDFIRPSELTRWASQAHLQLKHLTGVKYHPLSQQFNLHSDVSVNYMACYKKV